MANFSIADFLLNLFPNFGWEASFLQNTVLDFTSAIIAFIGFLAILKIVQTLILSLFKRTDQKGGVGHVFLSIIRSLRPPFYFFLAFYFALQFLSFSPFIEKVLNGVVLIWLVYEIILALQIFVDFIIKKKLIRGEERDSRTTAGILSIFARITLWVIGLIFVLSNMGVEVTTLIAGLGIGGVAVAFALQNILSDIFSSFAIYFDKPFRVGDSIQVGNVLGTVEHIGIKTTRIRALQGEEVVMSNKDLTSLPLQNFGKLLRRRVVLSIGVEMSVPTVKLKKISALVKEVITAVKKTTFDRAHLSEFGDFSYNFEVVYYAETSDYKEHMDIKENVLFGIKERLDKEKVALAYPTQTLHISKNK